jgi:hypothetical protein
MKKAFPSSLKWSVPILTYLVYIILMYIGFKVDISLWGERHGGGPEFGGIFLFVFLALPIISIAYILLIIADIIYTKNKFIYWIFAAFCIVTPIIFLIGCDYFYFGKIENCFFTILYPSMNVLLYIIPFFLIHYFIRKKTGK